MAQAVMTWI